MKELSLFAGAGGGLLGTSLLGFEHIGYVEYNDACQQRLKQRILDGYINNAPIFGDIRSFISEGYAESYKGMVDVLTAGFPCQPFSVAGSKKAGSDERNMWPETIRVIREVQPRHCLLENVPGLLSAGLTTKCMDDGTAGHFRYIYTIFRDLAEAGYNAKWCVLGADDCGAPHHRKRLWIYAYAKHTGPFTAPQYRGDETPIPNQPQGQNRTVQPSRMDTPRNVANTNPGGGKAGSEQTEREKGNDTDRRGERAALLANTRSPRTTPRLSRETRERDRKPEIVDDSSNGRIRPQSWHTLEWWAVEPDVGRVVDGVANSVDRLKALGNGQVPAVVRAAWLNLTR